jgi:GNAT superfamily N-acetyltransferase
VTEIRALTDDEIEAVDAVLPLSRLDSMQTYLVAWDGDKPVGHAHVAWKGGHVAAPEIQDMYVLPARRGQGIGAALIEAAERLAVEREHERMSLSVSEAGEARRLYERLGYGDAGVPPVRVKGTITIRGEPLEVDDTLVYLVKDLVRPPAR